MEQYIDEYGNLQFRTVGTNYPFRSMADMAAENELALNTLFNTPADTLTSLQNFQDPYYLPNRNPLPITSLGFDTSYGVANEPDVPQVPLPGQNKGIPFVTKAKNFITQTLPNMVKGGINMIPGIGMIQRLDKFDTLPYLDRQFIKSNMQGGIPGIFVDPNTGLLKDQMGKNVRSLLGNYAESIEERYEKLSEQLDKSKKNWENKFGSLDNTNQFGKTWSEMNKNNLNNFSFLTNMKNKKDKQQRDFLDKVKAQVKAGVTANIGQSLHGGNGKSDSGSNKTKSYSGPTGADIHGGMSMGSSNKSSYGGYQGNPHR
tara:strand:+ start:309 stop:1253 length:945 start_codon:yes stop_codon:yes gene_type:complete